MLLYTRGRQEARQTGERAAQVYPWSLMQPPLQPRSMTLLPSRTNMLVNVLERDFVERGVFEAHLCSEIDDLEPTRAAGYVEPVSQGRTTSELGFLFGLPAAASI